MTEWEESAAKLRKARALACELRSILEDVAIDEDETNEELESAINDAGAVESWLDTLKINEDGTSAEDGF